MSITDPAFAATFQAAVVTAAANLNISTSNSSNFTALGVLNTGSSNMTFTTLVASSLTVINIAMPENSMVNSALVQQAMTNATTI
eukprot:CAMPEP_0171237098 /NCGR_PEP_ID=MMETSP0790-20130122/42795_1 /TAXON_ID=2925 /ORGANISM="Alexandrium catenella, Strain OF101" /LENGTH=84 /DNA_ID=CAMNT_0011703447 /DNA_START=93 /DNA_END=344 /DNA_ORIENTATION=+